jgi:elongator complex protein 3
MYKKLIENIINCENFNKKKLTQLKIDFCKESGIKQVVKNPTLIAYCENELRDELIKKLNIKPIRESSGVSVLALFCKPHKCPHGKCIYCPGGIGSVFGDTPQSYTGSEPAAARAIRNNYDPYLQIFNRLEHYIINGHIPDKLEVIFMGGTFPSLDKEYKDDFVKYVYKAINDFGDLFIEISKKEKKIKWEKFIDFFELKNKELGFNSEKRVEVLHSKMLKLKNKVL